MEWIGYALDVSRFELGISIKRTKWAIDWIDDKIREWRVRLGGLKEGLGRLQILSGPLEQLRPFLGPLCVWACAEGRLAQNHACQSCCS